MVMVSSDGELSVIAPFFAVRLQPRYI